MLADPVTIVPSPVLDRLFVVYQHRHRWTLLTEEIFSREFPYDSEEAIFAVCTESECGARLSRDEIEAILDGDSVMGEIFGV